MADVVALPALRFQLTDLILRSALLRASRRMNGKIVASWFETREAALLTMRFKIARQ